MSIFSRPLVDAYVRAALSVIGIKLLQKGTSYPDILRFFSLSGDDTMDSGSAIVRREKYGSCDGRGTKSEIISLVGAAAGL